MEEMVGLLIPLAGIFMIICVVVIPIWINAKARGEDRQRLHETVRLLVEKGQPVSAEMLESLNSAPSRPIVRGGPSSDLRRGIVLVTVALGIFVWGYAMDGFEGYPHGFLVGISAFPGFIGLGFIVLGLLSRGKADR